MQQQQRVLADGWGHQTTGSVFCAESSLRYIYESHLPSSTFSPPRESRSDYPTHAKPQEQHKPVLTRIEYGTERANESVDLVEAEIARTCAAIRKQAASLPPSLHDCSVCLSTNATAQLPNCGHTFHPHCFLRWFRLNRSCPLCRGTVETVQLAEPLVVQNELEALMADMEDEPMQLMAVKDMEDSEDKELALEDQLMASSDHLMAFLDDAFDPDMEMETFEELNAVNGGGIEEEMKELPPPFPPASAVPNYWNVLNQGMTLPPRMVQIAPRPDLVRTKSSSWSYKTPSPQIQTQTQISTSPLTIACRCTGGCRNGRCACVKQGGKCGVSCRCTSCKNPFGLVQAAGANVDALSRDACFMHNILKTRDMEQRLQEPVVLPCCHRLVHVVDCLEGYTCVLCTRVYAFSWCQTKLVETTKRNHCAICKRCCDHRDVHCPDCNRCYFAGVTATLPCPCQEASRHKKRHAKQKLEEREEEEEDEGEGECAIM